MSVETLTQKFVAEMAGSKDESQACLARLLATGAYEKINAWFEDESERDIPEANLALIRFTGLIFGSPVFHAKPGLEAKAVEILIKQISQELRNLIEFRQEFRANAADLESTCPRRRSSDALAGDAGGREMTEQRASARDVTEFRLGDFVVPRFTNLDADFGAELRQYPSMQSIPSEFRRHSNHFVGVASALFFKGGKLADHGLRLKPGIDRTAAMGAIQSWLTSFAPKHEHKEATVAWALSEWTEPISSHQEGDGRG